LIFSPFFAILVTIVSGAFILSLLRTDANLAQSVQIVEEVKSEVENLQTELADLDESVEKATSSAAIERRLRDELLLQRPGEIVVQLPGDDILESEIDPKTMDRHPQDQTLAEKEALLTPASAWWQRLF